MSFQSFINKAKEAANELHLYTGKTLSKSLFNNGSLDIYKYEANDFNIRLMDDGTCLRIAVLYWIEIGVDVGIIFDVPLRVIEMLSTDPNEALKSLINKHLKAFEQSYKEITE